jgi:three-Cys-motif partner protein
MDDPYAGREQTKAKHFILRHYLQALAFKVLTFSDITYVDGFCGPWESKAENFSDSSFMIAINVLRDAQKTIFERDRVRRRIRCFFSDTNADAISQLRSAVAPFHQVDERFEIKIFHGKFENAVIEIQNFIENSFPLIFIDPTGWVGYPFETIKPILLRPKCEIVINFMYEFVNRFAHSDDPDIVATLDPILGGPGWSERLDGNLPRGSAVEKLFRQTLKDVGQFKFVVSTKIDRATIDRPHFYIAYGTKNREGLKAFRQTEYVALREHAKNRANAKEKMREDKFQTPDMFAGQEAEIQGATIDQIVNAEMASASAELMESLRRDGSQVFSEVVVMLLERYMLRETNIKAICADLAAEGRIQRTWGGGNRKPRDTDLIGLTRSK